DREGDKGDLHLYNDDLGVRDSFHYPYSGGDKPFEAHSLPPPRAPLLAGSLPPSRFLDDLPPLALGPQADDEFTTAYGSLGSAWDDSRDVVYAASCPATLGGELFGGSNGRGRAPARSRKASMLALEEEDNCTEAESESLDNSER
ncbi:unnamed protein product, partial [Discosporangium mesarthrocarpum]